MFSGQRVERTNARGRHNYVPEFKRWIVEQAKLPGMSVSGLAMSNQVNANQLRRWVMLHRRRAASSPAALMLPVTVCATAPVEVAAAERGTEPVEIEWAGAIVRVPATVDAAALRIVLEMLKDLAR